MRKRENRKGIFMPLQIIRQDITKIRVDAIVNTTNEEMVGYSGVDLAVHTVAGLGLDAECERLAPLRPGEAKITGGYKLPCKYVIHTSGPVWRGGAYGESDILRSCYLESLKLAVANRCRTVAFPLISAGVYQYPKDQVLKFAVQIITEFLFENELTVFLCVFDRESYTFSQKLFCDIKAFIDDGYVEARNEDFYLDFNEDSCGIRENTEADAISYARRAVAAKVSCIPSDRAVDKSLEEFMRDLDKPFALKLFDLIDERGMTDVECYKKANVDKKTFSKIKCNPKTYRPSKQTAVAFAIALRLNLEETLDLLASAGMTLSQSVLFDKIIRYFIQREIYDIFEINEALFEFDQPLLGSL